MTLRPGKRRGTVTAPVSKSHLHRLLIAAFLHDRTRTFGFEAGESEDIAATKRCLNAMANAGGEKSPVLDCGESGSTLRFLSPVAAALGFRPRYEKRGRLAQRPVIEYDTIKSGVHELKGNVSSQYVTGLLFALPVLEGDSEIRFTTPLESRGYVDMTLKVVRDAGVQVEELANGDFRIPGCQQFGEVDLSHPEGDWSGAAFWLGMNRLGSEVEVRGLSAESAQPDKAITELLGRERIDVSGCPDIFPVLSTVAGALRQTTLFTGTRRLKLKESDRTAAMQDVLGRFGVETKMTEDTFTVFGKGGSFKGGAFTSYGDHRIAMSVAVGATIAEGAVELDNAECAAKSYPGFFKLYDGLA